MRVLSLCFVIAATFFVAAVAAPAQAQATRTWVSGVGDDANPCSRTAPCKTFAGAISKTAASGEISVLDPGGFGGVTITKALSIVADGVEGGVLVAGTPGIVINAGVNDTVSLRGLQIEGSGSGTSGIQVAQAANVYISNTVVRGFLSSSGYGINIQPQNGPRVYLKNVEIDNNTVGIYMQGGSVSAGLVIDSCTISGNTTNSLVVTGSNSIARALGSSFASTGISVTNGAQLISEGNNFFAGVVSGMPSTMPTSTSPLQ